MPVIKILKKKKKKEKKTSIKFWHFRARSLIPEVISGEYEKGDREMEKVKIPEREIQCRGETGGM